MTGSGSEPPAGDPRPEPGAPPPVPGIHWRPPEPGAWTPPGPPPGGYTPPPTGGWSQPPYPHGPAGQGPDPEPPSGGRKPRRGWTALAAIGIGLVLVSAGAGVGYGLARGGTVNLPTGISSGSHSPISLVPQNPSASSQNGGSINGQSIAAKVDPAVVDINTTVATRRGQGEAAGTGMIITSSGEVLTNNHVIEGAQSISVTIQGRSNTYNATLIGRDPSSDVALLQIQGVSGLPTVTLADSSNLQVGQPIVAIGNALGQGGTPAETEGTISALNQSITAGGGGSAPEELTGMIEINAQIAEGDSGGPIVNSSGQVVGMITAGQSQGFRQQTSNVGYAVPSSKAASVVNTLRHGGGTSGTGASSNGATTQRGYLGVSVHDAPNGGALVASVENGMPAAQAGITANSVITAIDGNSIGSTSDLGSALQSHKPGDKVKVSWTDSSGNQHSATVTLAPQPTA